MTRTSLALLLAAAAPAAAGVWEEIGRNTDVTLTSSAHSRWVQEGRALDVGPVVELGADARLSIPASLYNLQLLADASRSLDGVPRLDRRRVGLHLTRNGERVMLGLGAEFRDHLGENPAAPARSFSEAAYLAYACLWAPEDGGEGFADDWSLALELASVPRRAELRGDLKLWLPLWVGGSHAVDAFLEAGSLHASDADGDSLDRVEGWSYAKASLKYYWTSAAGSVLYIEASSQAATEALGRAPGVLSVGWTLNF